MIYYRLTTLQRTLLILLLLAAGQATAIVGALAGWAPFWSLGAGLACTVGAALGVLANSAAMRSFIKAFRIDTRRIAAGDLTADVWALARNAETAEAMRSLQDLLVRLRRTLGSLRGGIDGVSLAAAEIAQGNTDLSSRTEQTVSHLQQATTSMARVTSTVSHTADSARTANTLAGSAREVAARGGKVVAQVVSTMDEIQTSSKKIADIIGTIDSIAFQTNILALNAAVEAARAGEQGRGFAVVASEVRSLAQRSAEAAREIKGLIGASVEKVESGSRLVQDAGATMAEIVASVQQVSDIIGEISAAAGEQSTSIGQINSAVVQLDTMTQQNAALVEQSAAAAESLKDQSRQLASAVAAFRIPSAAAPGLPARAPAMHQAAAARAIDKARTAGVAAPERRASTASATNSAAGPAPLAPSAPQAHNGDWETF